MCNFFFSFHLSIPKLSPKSESVVDKIFNQKSSFFCFCFLFPTFDCFAGNHNHCEKILVTLFAFHLFFDPKKRPLWNKKRPFFFCFSSLCMFFFQGKFTLFYGFFQYTQTGGLKWWHNLSSRKNKLQIGLKILRFKWRIVIMLGEEIVLQISSSCLSLSSFLFVDFFLLTKLWHLFIWRCSTKIAKFCSKMPNSVLILGNLSK